MCNHTYLFIRVYRQYMKRILFILFCVVVLVSCKNNDTNLGGSIKPESDSIFVCTDTFHLQTSNFFVDSIFLQNDTFLLGEIYNQRYGTTKADLLFQIAPPVNYKFPTQDSDSIKGAAVDSLVLYMYYKSWSGSEKSPLEFCLYEIDKKAIDYTTLYFSNINIDEYVSPDATPIGKKVLTSIDYSLPDSVLADSTFIPYIKYKLDISYAERFFNLDEKAYESVDAFQEKFKGFYITTDYGSSTMLHLAQIDLRLYYHYTRVYRIDGEEKTDNVSTWVNYSVNKEVRQINRIVHTDTADVKANLNTIDSLNLIKSPAGIYTNVKIPIGKMKSSINEKIKNNHLAINQALLNLEVVEDTDPSLKLDKPEFLLLLKKDLLVDYFIDKGLPTSVDTIAVIGYYDNSSKTYSFDMAYLLNSYFKKDLSETDMLDMVILPIDAISSTDATYITSVKSLFKLSGISVRSGTNSFSPLRLNLLYTGF